jgi:hypothetical protein
MMRILYLLILGGAFLVVSCQKSMEYQTINKSLDEFDTLTLKSVFTVELIQGTENSISIEGAKKIIEKVDIHIENNTLTLVNKFKGNWIYPKKNKIKIVLTVNGLTRINANETCNIKTLNTLTGDEIGLVMTSKLNEATLDVNCSNFFYWNNFPCGGKIVLSGSTNALNMWNVALMSVDAKALTTNIAMIENASKGDCKVNCLQKLTYKISGEGNIYVSGNPIEVIKIEESSTGKVIFE